MTAEEFHSVAADTRRECMILEAAMLRRILTDLQSQTKLIEERISYLETDIQSMTNYLQSRKVPFKTGTPPA